ncbi:hypothetical protein G5S52_12710 [Grimontia sp. S25]|uniref:Polysaccharide chain length determinant N-terminal domain-containing protein n=1 Tax=Grimontia sedimenti TaxID=2711294 RepID=A0A6M1RKX5_9GAMM|nr:hypothetical protein [Grimontia sedimenti]
MEKDNNNLRLAANSNGEIDIDLLVRIVKKSKLTVLSFSGLFFILSMLYVATAQEYWTSEAIVSKPLPQEIFEFRNQVNKFKSFFVKDSADETEKVVDDELGELSDGGEIFKKFIVLFNSNSIKKSFFESNEMAISIKDKAGLGNDAIFNEVWFKRISATPVNKKDKSSYVLRFQSTSQESSLKLLEDYISYVNSKLSLRLVNSLNALIATKEVELEAAMNIVSAQAKKKLEMKIDEASLALKIATTVGISQPLKNYTSKEDFNVSQGSKSIEAQIQALRELKNLSVVEPELATYSAKLSEIRSIKIERDNQFYTYFYLEAPKYELSPDSPKSLLIIFGGTILGLFVGFIASIFLAFRRNEK